MNIRTLNQYEKNLVLEALASLTEAEKKEVIKHIKSLKSLEAEAEAEAEASKVLKILEAEAEAEAKAEVFKKAFVKAEVKAIKDIIIKEAKAEAKAFYRLFEAKAEAEASKAEAEAYEVYFNQIAEAKKAKTEVKASNIKAEADLLLASKEYNINDKYYKDLDKYLTEAKTKVLEAEAEAEVLAPLLAKVNNLIELLAYTNRPQKNILIYYSLLEKIANIKAEAEAKAFIYVSNNINILAEVEAKEAKAKVKAEVLEVLTSKAKAEVKALVLTSEAFNNIEAYNKSIISNYINFNNLVTKTKLYNKFEHKYINSIISLNIMLFDNTYYVIIANDKVLKKLASLVTYKNLSYKDKRSLKAIKKASFKEAKASASLEAEASYINDILEASINFNFNSRYFITEVKAEAEAKAEAKAEVKAYLKALAIDNYFKFLRLKDLTLITEAEAEAFFTEALASNNQYKLNTSINDYYNTKEVFKNKKASNKVNTLYGLTSKTSNRFINLKTIKEAKTNNYKIKAKAKAKYTYEYILEAKAKAEAEAIAEASLIALLDNTSAEAKAEAEAKALAIQKLNFYICLDYYKTNIKEALSIKKASDLI